MTIPGFLKQSPDDLLKLYQVLKLINAIADRAYGHPLKIRFQTQEPIMWSIRRSTKSDENRIRSNWWQTASGQVEMEDQRSIIAIYNQIEGN